MNKKIFGIIVVVILLVVVVLWWSQSRMPSVGPVSPDGAMMPVPGRDTPEMMVNDLGNVDVGNVEGDFAPIDNDLKSL
ncbi:hypothetical protein HY967_04695 [Candidatus Jorgensenbacteria bacterium]|nr:hypothetical protein [Candidatus Jorgensenbacteria bacterium]